MRISDWSSDVCSSDLRGLSRHPQAYLSDADAADDRRCDPPAGGDLRLRGAPQHQTVALRRSKLSARRAAVGAEPAPLRVPRSRATPYQRKGQVQSSADRARGRPTKHTTTWRDSL